MSSKSSFTRALPDIATQPPLGGALPASIDAFAMIGKKELAQLLSVNPWTIDRWRKRDRSFPSPVWISDTTPRWYQRDIEQWLASRARGGVAPDWLRSKRPTKRSVKTEF